MDIRVDVHFIIRVIGHESDNVERQQVGDFQENLFERGIDFRVDKGRKNLDRETIGHPKKANRRIVFGVRVSDWKGNFQTLGLYGRDIKKTQSGGPIQILQNSRMANVSGMAYILNKESILRNYFI